MKKNNLSTNSIVSFIAILISIHYFTSFLWLAALINSWEVSSYLNSFSIFVLEDTLTFIPVSLAILLFMFIGFIGIIWIESLDSRSYENLTKFSEKNWRTIVIIISIPFIISLIFLLLINLVDFTSIWNLLFYVVIFLSYSIISTIFYFYSEKKILFTVVQFIILLISLSLTIKKYNFSNQIIQSKKIQFTELLFEYKNDTIKTSNNLKLLYHGYKYLILSDSIGKVKLYNINHIGFIEYQND